MYTECIRDAKPEVPKFHILREVLKVTEGKVYVSYVVEARSLNNLLASLRTEKIPGTPVVELTIDKIDKDFIKQITLLAQKAVQAKLDAFAATDGFDDMNSLTTYYNSNIPSWSTKAKRGVLLRDQTWGALYAYLNSIMAGTKPIPTSSETIFNELPALTWE